MMTVVLSALQDHVMRFNVLATALALGFAAAGSAHAAQLTDQPLVDSAWLQSHLGAPDLVVLDIRDATKEGTPYAAGQVPGALESQYSIGWRASIGGAPGMLPELGDIQAKIAALGIDNDTQVVIVPAGTNVSEFGGATRVYWTFKVLGHDNVAILDGGYNAWTAAGEPVSTDAAAPAGTGDFVANFRPELRAEVAQVQEAIANDVNLIDARTVAQFIGKEKTNTVKALGTIPTAVNINFPSFWDKDNGRFASKETIDGLIKAAGLTDKDGIITFCNTGHLASIAWFGLSEVAGLKGVRLYDGSMSQWTLDPQRPVVVHN
jgi:thiosulfate/3-mercaptopyruvate sulfurtransferase